MSEVPSGRRPTKTRPQNRSTTMKRILTALALSLLSGTALAQDTEAVFVALDTDQDGSISEMEAQRNEIVSEHFALADTNDDDSLSREEFNAAFG
jgi:Ca2+-binding EF-hand superfamily protein